MATRKTGTTTRKRTTKPRATTAKPAGAAPTATVVTDAPVTVTQMLGKKELIERAVARSGLKKRNVKPAVEAALAVIGEALANGDGLNLEPMGKLHVKRRKTLANGEVLTARLRRKGPAAPEPEGEPGPGGAPEAAA